MLLKKSTKLKIIINNHHFSKEHRKLRSRRPLKTPGCPNCLITGYIIDKKKSKFVIRVRWMGMSTRYAQIN